MSPDPPLQAAPVVAEVVAAVGKSATNHAIAAGNTSRKDSARERQVCRREAFAVYGGATTARGRSCRRRWHWSPSGCRHWRRRRPHHSVRPWKMFPTNVLFVTVAEETSVCTSETAPASYALLFENVLPEIVAELLSST